MLLFYFQSWWCNPGITTVWQHPHVYTIVAFHTLHWHFTSSFPTTIFSHPFAYPCIPLLHTHRIIHQVKFCEYSISFISVFYSSFQGIVFQMGLIIARCHSLQPRCWYYREGVTMDIWGQWPVLCIANLWCCPSIPMYCTIMTKSSHHMSHQKNKYFFFIHLKSKEKFSAILARKKFQIDEELVIIVQ